MWVATELGRTHILTGFPWVLLGYSQAEVLPIAQLASLFGVYGVSALVATTSAVAAHWVVAPPGDDRLRPAAVVAILILIVGVWGSRRASNAEWTRAGDPIRVGLIQGNIDQAREVGSGPRRVHFPELSGDDAAGDRPRRQARAVARVVDAVLFR